MSEDKITLTLNAEEEKVEEVVVEETIEISTPEDLQEIAANCIDNDWSRNKIIVLKNVF